MRKKLCLGLSALALSGCVSIKVPNTEVCTVAGILSEGAICAETQTHKTRDMTLDQFLDFLLPTDAHGGAICQSADDWNKMKTALEQACRELGTQCSLEIHAAISRASKD
jgi:hypothetical protein